MDERLLEVYELAALGDTAGARAALSSVGDVAPEHRAEMEAFLEALEPEGPVEEVDALESGSPGRRSGAVCGPAGGRSSRTGCRSGASTAVGRCTRRAGRS